MTTNQSITSYANAGYPAVAISTADEDRTIGSVISAVQMTMGANPKIWRIAASGGLVNVLAKKGETRILDEKAGFGIAFANVAKTPNALLIVLDFNHVIRTAASYRQLRDALIAAKENQSMIVLIGPSWNMPAELQHDVPVIDDPLPSREELNSALTVCIQSIQNQYEIKLDVTEDVRDEILDSSTGLTLAEAEGAIALSYVHGVGFTPSVVAEEKMKLVRNSGYLEVSAPAKVDDLGGLGGLREYIAKEVIPTLHDPILKVKALMLVGVPGTGKSLGARVIGAMLKRKVLRANISELKGSKVGQSENNMKEMLKLADAVAPCILFIDEADKGFGGHASSAESDGGTTLGMLGGYLTWSQDHISDVLVVMTCNDYSKLPAELTRAGRFDSVMFVDLPTNPGDRREIAAVHLRKIAGIENDELAELIAEISGGDGNCWTGAEIEQLVLSAARRTRRAITEESLRTCAKDIRPISVARKSDIDKLREWGTRDLRSANTPMAAVASATGRKIRGK